jgi:hypothetical protein
VLFLVYATIRQANAGEYSFFCSFVKEQLVREGYSLQNGPRASAGRFTLMLKRTDGVSATVVSPSCV